MCYVLWYDVTGHSKVMRKLIRKEDTVFIADRVFWGFTPLDEMVRNVGFTTYEIRGKRYMVLIVWRCHDKRARTPPGAQPNE